MVNGIPARNKDPNKKAADLAAFFTTSLFSSDQHLSERTYRCPRVNVGPAQTQAPDFIGDN